MSELADRLEQRLRSFAKTVGLTPSVGVRGVVSRVGDGVAQVEGLDTVGFEELVMFDGGSWGMALDLGRQATGGCRRPGSGWRRTRALPARRRRSARTHL
jgi:F0F1-type ATP synthase alpha subunit